MRLSDYLKSKDLTQAAFADAIEVSRITVNRYCNGSSVPGPKTMRRIGRETEYQVTANDFFPESQQTEAAE